MKTIYSIEFHTGSKEELLPDFESDFPYISTCTESDKCVEPFIPWHWHKAVELFYIKSGTLEYYTPRGKFLFPAGSGGMVNSNVLHMTRMQTSTKTIQLLHIFDTSFLAGEHGNRIEHKYFMPIIAAQQLEIIALYPDKQPQKHILNLIQNSFSLSEQEFRYEIKLHEMLTEIWLALFDLSVPILEKKRKPDKANDKIKLMLVYIHEHYTEKISISELAASAFLSERECFRLFHDYLHMTPMEYMKNYRLQIACRMLAKGQETITSISQSCGLGSSSYFGKVFKEYIGCTPMEYRLKWQNSDI